MLKLAVSPYEFQRHYFEQQPLLSVGALADLAADWQELDQLLDSLKLEDDTVQMFLGAQVPPGHFLDEVFEFGRHRRYLNKHRFYDLLHQGATLVINRAEDYSRYLKCLCQAVARFSCQPTTSNAYVTFGDQGAAQTNVPPANKSSFGKHWDTHDVFALQLRGKKHWQVFPPSLPLPLSHQISARVSPPQGPPAFECELCAGDLLYIPRGWWHLVTPLASDSFHLSVGTYPPTLTDYLLWLCGQQLPQLADARRSLIAGIDNTEALRGLLKSISCDALAEANMARFLASHQACEHRKATFHSELMLNKPGTTLNDNTLLSLTSIYPADLNKGFPLNGGMLQLDTVGKALVELLGQQPCTRWAEIVSQLPQYPAYLMQETLLNLSRYDLINLTLPDTNGRLVFDIH